MKTLQERYDHPYLRGKEDVDSNFSPQGTITIVIQVIGNYITK